MDDPARDFGSHLEGSTQQVHGVFQQEQDVQQAIKLLLDVLQAIAMTLDVFYQALRLRNDGKAGVNDDVEHVFPLRRPGTKLKGMLLFCNTEI
ncbi:hypothetical protein FHX15_005401 [Rhizobium sp. BK650]|uniref:hypothetical protein n=1 Tax=Rhizobium sp. BK650 TaxID=2586990 RepID=UPI001622C53E|nr:hypothetical protein [Rhizobium sp. BK650]MBB3660132.1 hypothetical protein [Rhizobium sp. BK650]